VPILGYFLLFGDWFQDYLGLVVGGGEISYWRVYFLYFGFSALAVASLVFSVYCPELIKLHGMDYLFVEREAGTLSTYRLASIRDLMSKQNFAMMYKRADQVAYGDVNEWVTKIDEESWQAIEVDDEDLNKAAQTLAKIKTTIWSMPLNKLMVEHFGRLKDVHRSKRKIVSRLYTFGFALIAVPTVVVFGQVLYVALVDSLGALTIFARWLYCGIGECG
jgi:hypothetical protein